jgi:broad specificity phosphatase PhoE
MSKKCINREDGKTYVYLIRHAHWNPPKGPHEFNPHHPLSKKGKIQAKVLAKRFYSMKDNIEVFICSSQGRAVETAEEISKLIKKKPAKYDELWEINKILWRREFYTRKYWKHWIKYKKRISTFNKILKENKGKVILIVAHGNVIKGILRNKQKLSIKKIKEMDYKNCNITLLKFKNKKLEKTYLVNAKEPLLIKKECMIKLSDLQPYLFPHALKVRKDLLHL